MLSEKTLSLQKNKYNSKISINDETEHYESSSSDSGLYGGLPYGDGEIFIVDNEDMIDQMDF